MSLICLTEELSTSNLSEALLSFQPNWFLDLHECLNIRHVELSVMSTPMVPMMEVRLYTFLGSYSVFKLAAHSILVRLAK